MKVHVETTGVRLALCLLTACGLLLPAAAQERAAAGADNTASAKQDLEFRYVDGLNDLGLPKYADIVLDRLGAGPEVKARRLDSSIRRGEWPKVLAVINAEPDQNSQTAWALKLRLADGYFAWGKYSEARTIYDKFFAQYPGGPPDQLKTFYYDSAYKFAQMLLLMKDEPAALKVYRMGIAGNPPRDTKRQFQADLADLLIKMADSSPADARGPLITEVDKIASELMWVQDLFFGKAVVYKAHVLMLQGNIDKAMALVDDYTDTLVQLDEGLRANSTPTEDLTRMSPMAQARYLLGVILLNEAKTILASGGDRARVLELLGGKTSGGRTLPGAFAHFMNVFLQYPNTKWALEAGAKAEEARAILEKDLRKQVKINVDKSMWAKVEAEQLKNAKASLNLQQYAEAADQYLAVLARFPDSENTVPALYDLATCYMELNDDLYTDVVTHYLAERFGRNKTYSQVAGNYVLNLASMYGDRGRPARKQELYDIFFTYCPVHPMAAQLQYSMGDRQLATNDFTGALTYYERVLRDNPQLPISYAAQGKISVCYDRLGDVTNQIKTLEDYMTRASANKRQDHDLVRNHLRLANAYRKLGQAGYATAVKKYGAIEALLSGPRDAYQSTPEEAAANQEILETAIFYKATCYARATPPSDKPEFAYKENALKLFTQLAEAYPKSKMAPAALSQAGTLYTLFDKAQEAEQAFKMLKTRYPDSQEAKDVDFQLGISLLELNRRAEAVKVFTQMFAGGGKYTDSQIMAAGIQLFDAQQFEIAIQAFDRVLAGAAPTDRAKVEPMLAYRGRTLVAMGRYADGAAALQDLFKRYPRSAYTVDGKSALSRAFAEMGATEPDLAKRTKLFNDSVEAMKEVIKYDNTPERRAASTVEVGNLFELRAKAEAQNNLPDRAKKYRNDAIATYQSLILFPSDQKARPYLETAYYRCMQLFLDSENWQDLESDATSYLRLFPNGKHVLEVRQWRSRAKARLAVAGVDTTENVAATTVTNQEPAAPTPVTVPAPVPEAAPVTNAP